MPVPSARIRAVADKFVIELNGILAGWDVVTPQPSPDPPLPVIARRTYSTQYAIDELSILHVDVQIVSLENTYSDRGSRTQFYGINVAVQQAVDPTDVAGIDALVDLVTAIFEHWKLEDQIDDLETVTLASSGSVSQTAVQIYSPVLLESQTKFFGTAAFVFHEVTA